MTLTPGQQWTYHAPEGFEQARMIIGAIANCGQQGRIICCSITSNNNEDPDASIPFLPMTETAFVESAVSFDGEGEPLRGFAESLESWKSDPRGLSVFTVPFKGSLNRLIADQVAAVSGQHAA